MFGKFKYLSYLCSTIINTMKKAFIYWSVAGKNAQEIERHVIEDESGLAHYERLFPTMFLVTQNKLRDIVNMGKKAIVNEVGGYTTECSDIYFLRYA